MDRDRRLCELMQICWHEWRDWDSPHGPTRVCNKCRMEVSYLLPTPEYPDFSTPEWRARLMDWAVEQEWWFNFEQFALEKRVETKPFEFNYSRYLWRNLPELVAEYWREKMKYETPADQRERIIKENIMDGVLMKYFVLKPSGNDVYAYASRSAMERYALIIRKENPQLADDLIAWVCTEEEKAKNS